MAIKEENRVGLVGKIVWNLYRVPQREPIDFNIEPMTLTYYLYLNCAISAASLKENISD